MEEETKIEAEVTASNPVAETGEVTGTEPAVENAIPSEGEIL